MATKYPVSSFHFQVEWGGTRIGFTEVSGLTVELQNIDYREGSYLEYQVTKMPGIPQYSAITLKRGIFKGDNEFFQWLNTVKLNSIERRDITISLLDEEHKPVVSWKAINAYITKIQSTDLKADGNEIAIETAEFVHEKLTMIE